MQANKYNGIILAGLVAASFLFFQLVWPYHLFLKEQIQLFLLTPDYFLSYFTKPAWLACYLGDFLTQFFYLKGGGALVLSLVLGIEWYIAGNVIARLTQSNYSGLWALLPVAIDWTLQCNTLHGLSGSAAFILVMSLFLLYAWTRSKWLSFFFLALFTITGYWLAGGSFLLFPLLALPYDIHNQRCNWLKWIPVVALTIFLPLFLRHHYMLTTEQAYIYPAFSKKDMLLPVIIFVVAVAAFSVKMTEKLRPKLVATSVIASFLLCLIIGLRTQASFAFEKTLALGCEAYFGNYDKVIEMAEKYKLKNSQAAYFTNMALARKGILAEKLLDFYQPFSQGLIPPVTPEQDWQSILVSSEVFYLIGDMNMAQHSAMLGNTFSPYQRSSRMMRRLAEINLATGDSGAAVKYLRILSKTMFYKHWADKQLKQIESGRADSGKTNKSCPMANADMLRKSNDYLLSLKYIAKQQPENTLAVDYLLCYLLLNKELKQFRENYDRFYQNRKAPKVYAEAILAQMVASGATQEEMLKYNIDPKTIRQFAEYTNAYDKTSGDMNALKEKFSRTYWLYYHFAQFQKK